MKREKVKSFICFINALCLFIYGLALVNGKIMCDAPAVVETVPLIIMFGIQYLCEWRGEE